MADDYLFGAPVEVTFTTGNFTRPTWIAGEPRATEPRKCPHCGGDVWEYGACKPYGRAVDPVPTGNR